MRKIYAFMAVCLLSISAWAADDYKIGYTVFDSKTGTLTYYYDYNSKRKDVGGSIYDPTIERFKGYASDIKKAVIDASFKDATTMKSTRRMFFSGNAANPLVNLTEITGNHCMGDSLLLLPFASGCSGHALCHVRQWLHP